VRTGLTARSLDGGVDGVGDGETELGARVPSLGRGFGIGIVEIYRHHIVRLPVCVSLGKEQDSPG